MKLRQMKKILGSALGLHLLAIVPLVRAQTKSQGFEPALSRVPPVLEMDLRKHGYRTYLSGGRDSLSLAFTDRNDIVFAWTTVDDSSVDKKIGLLPTAASHLHALLLDARTGRKKDGREWPASSFYATIHPVGKEKFLICTGKSIQLLSPDFDVIRVQAIPRSNSCIGGDVSPSRQSFSINTGVGNNYQPTLFDAESFAPIAKWSREARGVRFTDTLLVGTCSPQFKLCIRKSNQPWEPFHFAETDEPVRDNPYKLPFFVNDSILAIVRAGEMAVVTVEGALLFRVALRNGLGNPATSTGGERFALIESKSRGLTNEALDMYAFPSDDHVVVYSLHERMAIYTRKVKGTSPWSPWVVHRNRLALSPDGTLLAVLDDGMLAVYQLPADASSSTH